ncbi:hypothetical protein BDZ89DRAFT_1170303 [Hymenopellis radicata]|nr:hypothetical protein BDZ89DRAFT_1170303 [Hymenopellis radicata]
MMGLRDIAAGRDPDSKAELQDVFHSFPNGGHADTGAQPGYFKTIDRFLTGITPCLQLKEELRTFLDSDFIETY